jgi:hypothetical protein
VDAVFGEAAARGVLADIGAVVPFVADGLMREAVELRADMAQFGDDQFLIRAALVGLGVHEGALGMQVETARAEKRHAWPEHVRKFDDLTRFDQLGGLQNGLRFLVVHRAALVACAPFRWAALAIGGRRPAWRLRRGRAGREQSRQSSKNRDPCHGVSPWVPDFS